MSAVIQDDRTPEQRETLTTLIVATDPGMSGWGKAEGGRSYAAWATTEAQARDTMCTVERRGDMERIREVYDPPSAPYVPSQSCAHLHIYIAREVKPDEKFIVGRTYSTRSACDHECVFEFTVAARTARFVTLDKVHGSPKRCGIKTDDDGVEFVFPLGRHSMAPVIKAC